MWNLSVITQVKKYKLKLTWPAKEEMFNESFSFQEFAPHTNLLLRWWSHVALSILDLPGWQKPGSCLSSDCGKSESWDWGFEGMGSQTEMGEDRGSNRNLTHHLSKILSESLNYNKKSKTLCTFVRPYVF